MVWRRHRVCRCWLFCLALFPSCGAARREEIVTQPETFLSCSAASQPSFLAERVTISFAGRPLSDVIRSLRREHSLPVSFVEGPFPVQIEVSGQDEPVRSFLGRLLEQAQGYRCSIIEGHVVIYYDEPALHEIVKGVSITDELRGEAVQLYVETVSHQIRSFEGLGVLLGGSLESTFFTDRVTLAREATVLRHLCQLLGKYPDTCFSLRYGSVGGRYLTMGTAISKPHVTHRREPPPAH